MCNIKCIKILLFVFNFFFWLAGAAVLGIGIWTKIDPGQFDAFLGNSGYSLSANIMIAAGAFVMVIGFLGCCGAIKESKLLLGLFFACLFLIFAAEVTAGILGFLYRSKVEDEATVQITTEIKENYGVKIDSSTNQNVDNLQIRLKCCGITNYTDWVGSQWSTVNPEKVVPLSCCKEGANTTTCNEKDTLNINKEEGCAAALEAFVDKHLIIIGATGIAIACIQLLGMIFACCLFCSIDE